MQILVLKLECLYGIWRFGLSFYAIGIGMTQTIKRNPNQDGLGHFVAFYEDD